MQKRALRAALCFLICLTLITGQAAAADGGIRVSVDGSILETEVPGEIYQQVTYVHYWPILLKLDPNATADWGKDGAVIQAAGLTLHIRPGSRYLEANGRYLYLNYGVRMRDGICMIPATALAWALGGSACWDSTGEVMKISTGDDPILSGEQVYSPEDVYWLSRIIYAESGNQSLEGKIAVGNVILNRVSSATFPNTVYDVIFQRNQFSPVKSGGIYHSPNAESVIAAKICLEGTNLVKNAVYFINPRLSPNSWASRNCVHITTIGAHSFFA